MDRRLADARDNLEFLEQMAIAEARVLWLAMQPIPVQAVEVRSAATWRQALVEADLLRWHCANPIRGTHGYFAGCADAGGSAMLKQHIATTEENPKTGEVTKKGIGGMHAEVELHVHRAGKAAYEAAHGKQAYAARLKELTKNADKGAKEMSAAERKTLQTHLKTVTKEAARLEKAGKGDAANLRRDEALMLAKHLQRAGDAKATTKASAGAKSDIAELHATAKAKQEAEGLRAEGDPSKMSHGPGGVTIVSNEGIGTTERLDGFKSIDTQLPILIKTHGEHNLGAALQNYPPDRLRVAAKNLGLKTTGGKDAVISRITAHATHGRYSANFTKSEPKPASAKPATSKTASGTKRSKASGARQYPSPKADESGKAVGHGYVPYGEIHPDFVEKLYGHGGEENIRNAYGQYDQTMLRAHINSLKDSGVAIPKGTTTSKDKMVDFLTERHMQQFHSKG